MIEKPLIFLLNKPVVKDIGEIFSLIWQNKPFVSAILAFGIAQISKVFFNSFKTKKINLKYLFVAGSMPSSHSAMVCAITAALGLSNGWDSALFALSFVMSAIVMYDATGVRQSAGKQAKILNILMDDFLHKGKFSSDKLQELIGHTPFEVLAGAILGILVAFLMY